MQQDVKAIAMDTLGRNLRYNDEGAALYAKGGKGDIIIADLHGYGYLVRTYNAQLAEAIQDAIGELIVAAVREYLKHNGPKAEDHKRQERARAIERPIRELVAHTSEAEVQSSLYCELVLQDDISLHLQGTTLLRHGWELIVDRENNTMELRYHGAPVFDWKQCHDPNARRQFFREVKDT